MLFNFQTTSTKYSSMNKYSLSISMFFQVKMMTQAEHIFSDSHCASVYSNNAPRHFAFHHSDYQRDHERVETEYKLKFCSALSRTVLSENGFFFFFKPQVCSRKEVHDHEHQQSSVPLPRFTLWCWKFSPPSLPRQQCKWKQSCFRKTRGVRKVIQPSAYLSLLVLVAEHSHKRNTL